MMSVKARMGILKRYEFKTDRFASFIWSLFTTHQAAMGGLSWVLESRKESELTSNGFKSLNSVILLHQELVANGSMQVPRYIFSMPAALCVTNSNVLRNVAAIHCPEISANHQTLAVLNTFGCSSPFWIQFVMFLIWGFKSNITPFSSLLILGLMVSEFGFPDEVPF